jgi:hypothetical protein
MSPDLAALMRCHLEAENARDLEATLATLHPECAFEDFATGQRWRAHAGAADHYRQWWDTFDVEVRRGPGQRAYVTTDEFYVAEGPGTAGMSDRSSAWRRAAGRSCSRSW